jgi:hypothetical protein
MSNEFGYKIDAINRSGKTQKLIDTLTVTISLKDSEIAQLKEQLKRERDCVDFYADISSWSGEDCTGWNHTHIICIKDQEESVTGVWDPFKDENPQMEDEYGNVGGKLARLTQQQRK